MNAYFVTGTDTDVGKTTVSVGLLAAAVRRGLRAGCMKPAESGCRRRDDGALLAGDADALRRASNMGQTAEDVCLYRFEAAVAPGIAAAAQGVSIDMQVIRQAFEQLVRLAPDFVLVEGAGGLLVPFAESLMVADLAVQLKLPLLIVARPELGTINHTLLTLEAARARGLPVAGLILSAGRPGIGQALMASSVASIRNLDPVPYLGCLPFIAAPRIDTLANAAAPILDALLAPA